jgi:hypothetical protein
MKRHLPVLLIASLISTSALADKTEGKCLIENPICITKEGAVATVVAGALTFLGYMTLKGRQAKPAVAGTGRLSIRVPASSKIPSAFTAHKGVPASVVQSFMQSDVEFSRVVKQALGQDGFEVVGQYKQVDFITA